MHEFRTMQNFALGALAIRSFVLEYTKQSADKESPEIILSLPVLPLVFNERACKILWGVKRITNTRFLNTLSDHRDLPSGLQQRMENMADQTFRTLNFAFAANLIRYDPSSTRIQPVRNLKSLPKIRYGDNQEIIYAAKVLGSWFAYYSIEEICISLNIYF